MKNIILACTVVLFFMPTKDIQAKDDNSIPFFSKNGFFVSVHKDFEMEDNNSKTIFKTRDNVTTKAKITIITEDRSFSYDDESADIFNQVLEENIVKDLNLLVDEQIQSLSKDSDFKQLKKGDIILLNTTLRSDPAILGQEINFKIYGNQAYLTIYHFLAENKEGSKNYKHFTVYCSYFSKAARDKYTEDFNHALTMLVPLDKNIP